ncbi:hypothetical protein Halar_2784 [halophilic archaeon DL31]|nr:hypothetical protein Halar_2784 [halophilic archaeon DL31]
MLASGSFLVSEQYLHANSVIATTAASRMSIAPSKLRVAELEETGASRRMRCSQRSREAVKLRDTLGPQMNG